MPDLRLTLPDGSVRTAPAGSTGRDVARAISEGLARAALAVKVDGEVRDLDRPLERDAGFAVLTRTEFLLALLGGLFVLQTLSVILQVGFFKVTKGKRLFRMAPLHHHFELLGWEEVTVVIRFWIITGLFVAGGLGVFYAEWVAGT